MNVLKKQSALGTIEHQDWHGSTSDCESGDLQTSSADTRKGAQRPIRLLLVDSMPVVLRGIEMAAKATPNVQLVGVTGDHDRAMALTKQVQPSFLLLDILGRTSGSRSMRVQVDVLRKIRRMSPDTRCIVFTNFHPKHMVETVLEQGVAGVWSKFDDITELVGSLPELAQGKNTPSLSPSIRAILEEGRETAREAGWLAQLTPREREVLKLVLEGEDSYQIGERLGISPRTVSTHRSRILQKTNSRSFFELIGCLQQLEELGH